MSTAGAMITRDIVKRYLLPNASDNQQKLFGRFFVIIIVALALLVAATATDALVLLGGLAVAYGFQMWPALIAICFWPWLTSLGITLGLNCRPDCSYLYRVNRAIPRNNWLGKVAAYYTFSWLGYFFQFRYSNISFIFYTKSKCI